MIARVTKNQIGDQGCQMGLLSNQENTNLGKFWSALYWKMLKYSLAICNISMTFGISNDHLVHFLFVWYIFPVWVSSTKKNLATLFVIAMGDSLDHRNRE
jgi:hypothetical protein